VSGLSGYVFDSAIRGNFDPFLSQLASSPSTHDTRPPNFSDVFELAQCHSALLNDILSACLLRSGQKGVGDLLRHSMETDPGIHHCDWGATTGKDTRISSLPNDRGIV
jgi:hypothetical protein